MKKIIISGIIALSSGCSYAGQNEDLLLGIIIGNVIIPHVVQPRRTIDQRQYNNPCDYIHDSIERAYCKGQEERRIEMIRRAEQEAYNRGRNGY